MKGSVPAQLLLVAQQSAELAILLVDPRGMVTWWSPGARRVFGYEPEAILARPVGTLFVPEDVERGVPEQELAVATARGFSENDRWMLRADGSRFWAIGVMNALRDRSRRLVGFAKVLRDRTNVMEQIQTLRNRVEALERENHRKDVFLSTLSHELRNPLAPMVNAMDLIRASSASCPELVPPLGILERQASALRRLIDDLLDLTRIGAGKIELKLQTQKLQDVLQRSVEAVRSVAERRRQRLELVLPAPPIWIEGDPERLEQVFVNLLNNAIRYTPEGGSIWVTGTSEDGEAVALVQDNGIGIPAEILPHIFDLFTQADSARQSGKAGLGIGLAVVRDLVDLHRGTVQVRSPGPGRGSEFAVRLPLKRPRPD